jgi:hypothetical protein
MYYKIIINKFYNIDFLKLIIRIKIKKHIVEMKISKSIKYSALNCWNNQGITIFVFHP